LRTSTSGASVAVLQLLPERTSKLALVAVAVALVPLLWVVYIPGLLDLNTLNTAVIFMLCGTATGLLAWARIRFERHLRGQGYAVAAVFLWPALLCLVYALCRLGFLHWALC
jgi:hypothetical protein